MLIELEIKIKLPIIVFFILHEGMFEKFIDVILDKQRVSKDSHDLNNWATDLMIMFNDTNETICDDGNMDLNTDGILTLAPKGLYSKMLLDPFEEQFDLPSVFIKERNFIYLEIEVIRIVCKFSLQIRSIVNSLLSLADHIAGKLFINSIITESIGLRDDTSVWCGGSETEIVRTFGMSLDYVYEFPKTDTARKLCKYKHTKMIPMSKTPFLCPVVVSADNTIELTFEPVGYLVEDIVPNMHSRSILNLGTKIRISNVEHSFQELLCCA